MTKCFTRPNFYTHSALLGLEISFSMAGFFPLPFTRYISQPLLPKYVRVWKNCPIYSSYPLLYWNASSVAHCRKSMVRFSLNNYLQFLLVAFFLTQEENQGPTFDKEAKLLTSMKVWRVNCIRLKFQMNGHPFCTFLCENNTLHLSRFGIKWLHYLALLSLAGVYPRIFPLECKTKSYRSDRKEIHSLHHNAWQEKSGLKLVVAIETKRALNFSEPSEFFHTTTVNTSFIHIEVNSFTSLVFSPTPGERKQRLKREPEESILLYLNMMTAYLFECVPWAVALAFLLPQCSF